MAFRGVPVVLHALDGTEQTYVFAHLAPYLELVEARNRNPWASRLAMTMTTAPTFHCRIFELRTLGHAYEITQKTYRAVQLKARIRMRLRFMYRGRRPLPQ